MAFQFELNKVYRLLALKWDEQWEFDHPTVLLSPCLRCYEDGRSFEGVFEDIQIDGALDIEEGKASWDSSNEFDHEHKDTKLHWRGWNLKTLKRRAREAEECFGRFVKNTAGEVEWEDVEL